MNSLIYIYENEHGVTCFDRYFQYLKSIEEEMPHVLASFAMAPGRYELQGENTLHDAWLTSLDIKKMYAKADAAVNTSVTLTLLSAQQTRAVELCYFEVEGIQTSLAPDRWPARPVDLLTHEITRVREGVFRHHLQFDRGVWVDVSFRQFSIREGVGQP